MLKKFLSIYGIIWCVKKLEIVKAYINKLKGHGNMEVKRQGVTRMIKVLKELPLLKYSYKKNVMIEFLDRI